MRTPSPNVFSGTRTTSATRSNRITATRPAPNWLALLRDHILIAADVVKAAKAGDKPQLEAAQKKWSANGKDIAAFLAAANPNWPKADLEAMLQKHLDLTTGEVVGRLTKDWAADIKSYDEGHAHMLMFADMLTDGIVKQFPAKFAK